MSLITFRAHYQVLDIRFSHNKNSECSSIIHKIELWRKERHWIYFIATYFEILKKEKRGYLITLQIHSQLFLLFSFKTDYIKHLIFFFLNHHTVGLWRINSQTDDLPMVISSISLILVTEIALFQLYRSSVKVQMIVDT